MFEEDDRGDLLVVPTVRPNAPASELEPESRSELEPELEPELEIVRVKTLREMLYDQEPWFEMNSGNISPGIRRLTEKRVNRVLTTVADWMLGLVEQHVGDEMALVVLLEQAEAIRAQIIWPEREAFMAQTALAQETQEHER